MEYQNKLNNLSKEWDSFIRHLQTDLDKIEKNVNKLSWKLEGERIKNLRNFESE